MPIANTLFVLGTSVASAGIPLQTTGATDVVTIQAQRASAQGASSAANAGIASFNSADFTVDANGYVTFTGSGALETLTGDSGGAVSPTANNINIKALYTNSVVGNPGTSTLTVTPSVRGYPITPYVVGPSTFAGYQTIQSAVNAANAAGGGVIGVQPGTYTENLTLYTNCHITGLNFADAGGGVTIIGVHTPPTSGGFVFNNVALQSATDIFNSAAAGSAHLIIANAMITVTNGYTFNLLNWTGKLEIFDVNDRASTNDGFVNNTGGATLAFFEAAVGAGSSKTMTCSGSASIFNCAIGCPINCVTGSNVFFELNVHLNPITFSNNSTGEITLCEIDAQVTMSSSGSVLIATSIINTSSNPAVAGSGAGTLSLNNVTFVNNASIANTLTLSTSGGLYPPGNVGTTGFIWTSNGPGVCPTFQAASASGAITTITGNTGGAISPTAGNINTLGTGSITISGSGSTLTTQLTGLTNHSLLVGAGTATMTNLGVATNGQLPIGSAGADPVLATLTAGTGISITNGAGSITIATTGTTTLNYTSVNHAASPYTVLVTDDFIGVDSTAGVVSILLPNAPVTGRVIVVKDSKAQAVANNITVTTVGGVVNIDGATTYVMKTNYQSIQVIFNGTSYEVF